MNPLVIEFFKRLLPYAIAASVGFAVSWYIQGLRINAVKQELTQFKLDAQQAVQVREAEVQKVNKEMSDAWTKDVASVRECYRSGRCRVLSPTSGGGVSVPGTPAGANGAGQDAVPSPARVAEECAETTLQLNSIQDWIERVSKK